MITKYKTYSFSKKIEEVQIIRETDKRVYIESWNGRERREDKRTADGGYFDTWADAHLWLLNHTKRRVEGARRSLELANSVYENVKGMKAP